MHQVSEFVPRLVLTLVSVAARFKAWVCDPSLTGIAGSNPSGGIDVSHVSVVCCQVEVSATDRSIVQSSPTDCVSGVIRCNTNYIDLQPSR